MPKHEEVLVVERTVFDRVGAFQGLSLEVEPYLAAFFAPGVSRFVPRAAAETDPALKQIIPYVILATDDRVLSYVRGKRAGETRLVDRRSIGIGGHINPVDALPLFADPRDAYLAAVEREVAEEIDVRSAHTDNIVAVLNDDSTEVGRVHLGVVHYWRLTAPDVGKREQMMTQLAFLAVPELQMMRETLESWSLFCLDRIDEIRAACGIRPAAVGSTHAVESTH